MSDITTVGKTIDKIEVRISYRIIELFSAGLYSSPNKAFEELVCNSYDAFASKVAVFLSDDLTVNDAYIWVCDNGEGMNASELKDLWRIGVSTKRLDSSKDEKRLQIGQFGIGKLSTYILARKLTYLSKKDGKYISTTMDYEQIKNGTDSEPLLIDEREITETDAHAVINQYVGKRMVQFELFGEKSPDSWTLTVLTDLKPKAKEITLGRLAWVLQTALPLNPGFDLFFNGARLESSRIRNPIMKQWVIGKEDYTANLMKDNANAYSENNAEDDCQYFIDFENLKRVYGTFTLYEDSFLDGKSNRVGRSHGIFLIVRGRLINLDDPLLGMTAFTHGVFNRMRIEIHADGLDSNLTSTRESVKESAPYVQLKEYISKKITTEIRKYYFDQEAKRKEEMSVSERLSLTSYTTSKRPIYHFIEQFFNGRIINPFLLEKPDIKFQVTLLNQYESDLDTGEQVIEKVDWAPLAISCPIAKLDVVTRKLTINELHPYIANYISAYKNRIPLESIAITEVLTEAHLYELSIQEADVHSIMVRRDSTLRQLALTDREGIPAVALALKDSLASSVGLEEAVYRAFLALGFETVKIGGNGKPDGKADAILGYDSSSHRRNYSLTFDAKSTKKDRIQAATAHLSGLKRHQTDYAADYAVEVAIGYEGEFDSNSAISKEAREQKVTIFRAQDLVKLMFLVTPKQIGLNELRNLFETCYAPIDVHEWIENLENKQVFVPPYFAIIDEIYAKQKTDIEPPSVAVIRQELLKKFPSLNCTSTTVKEWIKLLVGFVPGCVSMDENGLVGVHSRPESIKAQISGVITNYEIPTEMHKLYDEIFR